MGRGVEQGVKGQSAGIGRMHGSCQSSSGTWCWQSSERGQCSDPPSPRLWQHGLVASVLPSSGSVQCCTGLATPLSTVVAVARGAPAGFGTAVLCPCLLPIPSFRAVCGAGLSPSRLHRLSRPRQGPADDAPAAPLGPVPAAAQVWLWSSSCSPCARDIPTVLATSLAFPMSESCATSCVPPLCASVCPVSLQHVPAACPMSP